MILFSERKPENPERTQLHRERPQLGFEPGTLLMQMLFSDTIFSWQLEIGWKLADLSID